MDLPREDVTNQDRLRTLIAAGHPCIFVITSEEQYALDLVRSTVPRGYRMISWSATRGVTESLFEDAQGVPNTENLAAALHHILGTLEQPTLCVALDVVDHLDDARSRRALRDLIRRFREKSSCLVVVDHNDRVPEVIAMEATTIELSLPTEAQLEILVKKTLKRLNRENPVDVNIRRSAYKTLVRNLQGLTRTQAEQIIADCIAEDRRFDANDINTVLALKRRRCERDGVLHFVESPVDLSEIGGLRNLKRWLELRKNALSDEARAFGVPAPRGILLLGVQGAGKSLCAKAAAAAWQRPLLLLDPGTLYDRYVGESERRLRSALHQAEAMAPVVLWIDEIEKGFASAASQSSDGGLSQRMFGTLLTWMQEHEAPVFLFATANNIEALPPELLRKGRFDEIFFIDLPSREVRRQIFGIHLVKRHRDPSAFDLDVLADASEGYSGAEIEQAVIAALHLAFAEAKELDTERILESLEASPPISVTMAESIQRLRQWAKDRCVPADT